MSIYTFFKPDYIEHPQSFTDKAYNFVENFFDWENASTVEIALKVAAYVIPIILLTALVVKFLMRYCLCLKDKTVTNESTGTEDRLSDLAIRSGPSATPGASAPQTITTSGTLSNGQSDLHYSSTVTTTPVELSDGTTFNTRSSNFVMYTMPTETSTNEETGTFGKVRNVVGSVASSIYSKLPSLSRNQPDPSSELTDGSTLVLSPKIEEL